VLQNMDRILDVLVREGFQLRDANTAYGLVSSCVLGAVVGEQWEEAVAGEDGDFALAYRRAVDAVPKRQLTRVRQLSRLKRLDRRASFDRRIEILLHGIAAELGLTMQPVRHPPAGSLTR
jgi:hypothetical protein